MLAKLIEWLRDWWAQRSRRLDLDALWPACKQAAGGDASEARAAFFLHASHDPAWQRLGLPETLRQVSELK